MPKIQRVKREIPKSFKPWFPKSFKTGTGNKESSTNPKETQEKLDDESNTEVRGISVSKSHA
jgi:hypothetical protein